MCRQCLYAVEALFPEKSDQERVDILWNFTAFPAGSAETIVSQLEEHQRKSWPCRTPDNRAGGAKVSNQTA